MARDQGIDTSGRRLISDGAALTRRFARAEGGSIAIIFAFSMLAVFGSVGSAVDFVRYSRMKTVYASAIDAAALAAGRTKQLGGTDADALAAADSYIAPVKAAFPLTGPIKFSIADNGLAIETEAKLSVPTVFMSVFKIDKLDFTFKNRSEFAQGSDVEIALMLDVTGSMSGSKITDLKNSVEHLMDVVIRDESSSAQARIGLAPFSAAVKLKTKHFREATGLDNSGKGSYKGCVVERTGSDAYTDAAPGSGRFLTPLEDVAPDKDCDEGREIFPLSNKKSDLKKMVKSLSAGGMTAGHLGTAWAWYLLSPSWNALYDSAEQPAPYSDLSAKKSSGIPKLRKIAVLMTDGEYNTAYLNTNSTTQARAICSEMKKTGIEVFTVGFEVGTSGTVVDTLMGCATTSAHFYNASNGAELKKAFNDIALKSSPLRLSK